MGTVKYTGPVASFHCPTNAEIRSLKVHFSPKQEGTGNPSPENVRPIVGWDGVEVQQRGKNLFDANNPNIISPNCWVSSNAPNKITASNADRVVYIECLPNTTYVISKTLGNVLAAGYTTELPATNVQTYSYMRDSANARQVTVTTGTDAKYLAVWFYDSSKTFDKTVQPEDIYKTLQIEYSSAVSLYEPYQGSTTNYEFGVLGKNKLNADAEQQAPDNTNMMPTNKRIFTPNTYCVGMSWSNYYTPNNVTSYSVSNGTITVTNGNVYGLGYPVYVRPSQTYFLSATTTNGRAHIAYFSSDGTYISGVSTDILNKSFTVPNDVDVAVIVFFSSSGEATFSNIQLELGSTATAYEPYDPKHTVYGGWVDLISGEVCEEWVNAYAPLNATWNLAGSQYVSTTSGVKKIIFQNNKTAICSHTKGVYNNDYFCGLRGTLFTLARSYLNNVGITDQTSENINIYLQNQVNNGTPVHSCGLLETPITYYLAPTTLQTFLGQNNVWSNADYVEVEYDLHETQDILNRKAFIMANQPHIVKPVAASLQNFKTDVIAPLKECKVYFGPVQDLHGYDNPWPAGSGKNIFPYPYVDTTKTDNGITFTDLGDGQIKITGTNSSSSYVYFVLRNDLDFGDTYNSFSYVAPSFVNGDYTLKFFGMVSGVGAEYYTNGLVRFRITSGATVNTTVGSTIYKTSDNLSAFVPYENVCPISGWTGCNIYQARKNLVSQSDIITNKYVRAANTTNYSLGSEAVDSSWSCTSYIKVFPNTIYTVSVPKFQEAAVAGLVFYSNTTIESAIRGVPTYVQNSAVYTFTTPSNCHYLRFSWNNENGNEVQLELGSTATFYEPYSGTTLPIDWTTEAGTVYGGYVDLVRGEVVAEYILMEKLWSEWTLHGEQNNTIRKYTDFNVDVYESSQYSQVSKISNIAKYSYEWTQKDETHFFFSSSRRVYMWLPIGTDESTVIQVVGHLITPIHYSLTPSTLKTLRGVNNIWSNTGDQIELAYWGH